jgi:tRNA-splicing ligase RtcB
MIEERNGVRNWASILDEGTRLQAEKLARSPAVSGPVALMPDAHVGIGATVGSVIVTENAIIPAAVGVDIGCGMIACRTDLVANDLPDTLQPLISVFARDIPGGVGKGHSQPKTSGVDWMAANRHDLTDNLAQRAQTQLGTLGSGNHFLEVCLDEQDQVWVVVHSGSRVDVTGETARARWFISTRS